MSRYSVRKKRFECNCKHKQETNTRQNNATPGHDEQETQFQKPDQEMNMFDSQPEYRHEKWSQNLNENDNMNTYI